MKAIPCLALCFLGLLVAPPLLQAQTGTTPEQRFFTAMATVPQGETKTAGGAGGKEFKKIFPDGGILVGFEVWQGAYAGAEAVIYGLQPIYQTLAGRQRGNLYGKKAGEQKMVEAKEGDAVTALQIRTGSVVDGIQLMYQKIDYFGYRLTAVNPSKSDLMGGEGGAKRLTPLTTNGKPIVGIFGAGAMAIDRIGLIYANKR